MKKFILALSLLLSSSAAPLTSPAQDWGSLLQGGLDLIQSFTVTDGQVKQYVRQFVQQNDQQSQLAPSDSPYTVRLSEIVSGITEVDGTPLNFKVYITKDINAFACADGSVRVYSGLMDVMNDDEVLGVIGHEIGHVAHHDTKNAMKAALRTSAFRNALGSVDGVVGQLSKSQLGTLGESIINNKYSQKQESNADDYAYTFLKNHGKNPLVLAMAFKKLKALESSSMSSLAQSLFSDHPDTGKRIKDLEKRAKKDGYTYPSTSSVTSSSKTAKTTKTAKSTKTKK